VWALESCACLGFALVVVVADVTPAVISNTKNMEAK
jgi:hypothetical protein